MEGPAEAETLDMLNPPSPLRLALCNGLEDSVLPNRTSSELYILKNFEQLIVSSFHLIRYEGGDQRQLYFSVDFANDPSFAEVLCCYANLAEAHRLNEEAIFLCSFFLSQLRTPRGLQFCFDCFGVLLWSTRVKIFFPPMDRVSLVIAKFPGSRNCQRSF